MKYIVLLFLFFSVNPVSLQAMEVENEYAPPARIIHIKYLPKFNVVYAEHNNMSDIIGILKIVGKPDYKLIKLVAISNELPLLDSVAVKKTCAEIDRFESKIVHSEKLIHHTKGSTSF